MKSQYMLKVWGGFYNKKYQEIHGHKPGYYFFDTKESMNEYLSELKTIEENMNARHLAYVRKRGNNVRNRTIAKIVFIYDGIEYPYEYDFGFAFSEDYARYIFSYGNYSCDCNRSMFLSRKYEDFPELNCGSEIEMKSIEVYFVRDETDRNFIAE